MSRLNVKLVLTNKVYLFGVFLFLFFSCAVLLYQEKSDTDNQAKAECLEWVLGQEDPMTALSERKSTLYDLGSDTELFTGTVYYDIVLLGETEEYLKDTYQYDELLESILDNAKNSSESSFVTYEMRLKNLLSYAQYSSLDGISVEPGNYIAWEKFFSSGVMEAAFVLLLLYTMYYMAVIEREKGMNGLVHATKNGGAGYFIHKLFAAIFVMLLWFILFFGAKLLIYISLYGTDDVGNAIQAVSGFSTCPYCWSIGEYLAVYLLHKLLFMALLTLIILALSALPVSEVGLCAIVGVFAVLSWIMADNIQTYSKWVTLRDVSPFVLGDVNYWYSTYHITYFGQAFGFDIYLNHMWLPFLAVCIYALIFLGLGMGMYQHGLRKSTAGRSFFKRLWSYRGSEGRNELVYLLFQKGQLLAAVVLVAAAAFMLDFKSNENAMQKYEREMLTLLNEKSFDEASAWLDERRDFYSGVHESITDLGVSFGMGEISEDEYNQALITLQQQLSLESLVEQFYAQSESLAEYREETGDESAGFYYESLENMVYGDDGRNERILLGMLMSVFAILSVLTVFPSDRQQGMNRLIGSTAGADKSVSLKRLWMAVITGLLALALYGMWFFSLRQRMELTCIELAAQSWDYYRDIPFHISVKTAIGINLCFHCIRWAIFAWCLATVSLYCKTPIWAQMLGILALLGPLMLDMVDITWVRHIPYYSFLMFGEEDLLKTAASLIRPAIWVIIGIIIQKEGKKRWVM